MRNSFGPYPGIDPDSIVRFCPRELFCFEQENVRIRGGARVRRKKADFAFAPGAFLSGLATLVNRFCALSAPAVLSLSEYRAPGAFLDSEVLEWVAHEIINIYGSDIQLVSVRSAIWLARASPSQITPELKVQMRSVPFLALGFDGPAEKGHFYLLHAQGPGSPIVVYESHPPAEGQHRRFTRAVRNILGGRPVQTVAMSTGEDSDCAMQTARAIGMVVAGHPLFSTRDEFVDWIDDRLSVKRVAGGASGPRGVTFSLKRPLVIDIPARDSDDYADGGFFRDPTFVAKDILQDYHLNCRNIRNDPAFARSYVARWAEHIDLSSDCIEFLRPHCYYRKLSEMMSEIARIGASRPLAEPPATHSSDVLSTPVAPTADEAEESHAAPNPDDGQAATSSCLSSSYLSRKSSPPCRLCSRRKCRCFRLLHEHADRVKLPHVQCCPSPARVKPRHTGDTPRDMMKAVIGVMCADAALNGALCKLASQTINGGGISRRDLCEAVLQQAPRMTSKDIVTALKDAGVGTNVMMTWRFTADMAGATRTRTWVGEVVGRGGTVRSPTWRIRWDTTPVGDLDDEGGERVAHPVSSLPAPFLNDGGENAWQIDILAVHPIGPGDGPATEPVKHVDAAPSSRASPPRVEAADEDADFDDSRSEASATEADDDNLNPSDSDSSCSSSSYSGSDTSSSDEDSLPPAGKPIRREKTRRSNNEIATGILARNAKVDRVGNYAPIGSDEQPVLEEHWPAAPSTEPDAAVGVSRYSGRVVLEALKNLDPIARQSVVPTIVWSSLSSNTIADHFRELKRFREYLLSLPDAKRDLPVDILLAHHFQREWASTDRRTMWTTMSTRLRSIVGAFSMLPVYAPTTIMIRPNKYPVFSAMMTTANRKAVEQPGRQPVPATFTDVKRALDFLPTDRLKWLLITSWFTSSRPTIDTVYVEKRDFVMNAEGKGFVTFRRSKTARKIGAYTIPLDVSDPECVAIVQRYFDSVTTDFMIPLPMTGKGDERTVEPKVESSIRNQLIAAVRKVRPELEIKSFRRGTIARLVELKLKTPDILLYTKHTQEKGLKRYLNDEQILHTDQLAARDMAAGLGVDLSAGRIVGGADPEERFFDLEDWIRIGSEGSVITTGRPPADDTLHRDRSAYPIHCKPETREGISFDKLDGLPTADPLVREFWQRQRMMWLSDDTGSFSSVPIRECPMPSTLTEDQAQQLVAIDNIVEVSPLEHHLIKGWIVVFLTPEDAKLRWRVIKHPIGYNDTHGKDTVEKCGNATRRSARQAIPSAECAIAVDLAGFFDQLRLPGDISWHQCFRVGNKIYRNLRVPMGGRHSTQIATAVTRMLLSFDHQGVRVDYCTDNVRFTGPRHLVVQAAETFLKRCSVARAKLNEIDVDSFTKADVENLVAREHSDYVGEVADFGNKTICCRQKHVDKLLALVNALRGIVTTRQLFAPYAMLLYMSETLGLRLDAHWPARQFYSEMARSLATNHDLWNARNDTRPPADFHLWVSEALANRPAVVSCPPPPDVIAIGDACELGFAAIFCTKIAGEWTTRLFQRAWSRAEKTSMRMHLSTSSEPEAAVRVALRAAKIFPGQRLLYVSDHEPFVKAVGHGCSMRPEYNSRVRKFRNAQMQGELQFLEGVRNLADKFSRFKAFRLSEADHEDAVTLAEQALAKRDMGACFVGAREDLPARAVRRL